MSEINTIVLPTVPLRGLVMFPTMRIHFEVGRVKSVNAVRAAVCDKQRVFLVAQKKAEIEDPDVNDVFRIGVVAEIKQVLEQPDTQSIRVVAQGIYRAKINEVLDNSDYLLVSVECKKDLPITQENEKQAQTLVKAVKRLFNQYTDVTEKMAAEVINIVNNSDDPSFLSDFIAGNAVEDFSSRQRLLNRVDSLKRLEILCEVLLSEMDLFVLERKIEERVQKQMDEGQNEYYLREKMRAISIELGEDEYNEIELYRKKIVDLNLSKDITEKLISETDRLAKMSPGSPDANVIRSYLDVCLSLPWNKYTEDRTNIENARKTLDSRHYALTKVKERFIEMLAVHAFNPNLTGQIICLVGPPGVGKTSIVRSIADAMGRKYVRLSLGGVNDEAEIRGHRKTYVGAMPGRIVNAIKQAQSFNPIILLDEIDKLSSDRRGDPSSALLEALDPEQNNSFSDHYIEFPIDLSKVIFITTANDSSMIPAPLYDRMEIIEVGSYTFQEKMMIAKNHLIKNQRAENGLTGRQIRFSDDAIKFLIDGYTREAGVRKLEQVIAAICRKSAVKIANGEAKSVKITANVIQSMLGPVKFKPEVPNKINLVGVVNGLAWTSVGGELLQVEAITMDGSGKLELTGSLGDVMKESAKAALSYIKSVSSSYNIDYSLFRDKDIHIHVPQGAVPKDGPSAGVTIATALISSFSGKKIRQDIAMTGEITLTGRVLPIGGLKEKTMAAYKSGIKTVIIPSENQSDLWEIDESVKSAINFIPVSHLSEVFSLALIDDKTQDNKSRRILQPAAKKQNKKSEYAQ